MLLSAFLFGLLIPGRFSVTTTPSLVHRIYLISRITDAREIRKDSYVLFTMRNRYMRNGQAVDVMGKASSQSRNIRTGTFGPRAGNEDCAVRRRDRIFEYRTGGITAMMNTWERQRSIRYGERRSTTSSMMTHPPGKLFVMGEHRDSFDSLYFGFIEVTDVMAIGHAIW